ncbi:DUF6274 family protein [Streptomyces sp. NPDC003656]|uniref:DUF6274 family protein n=1 Tax=unclassified Streptomyces TaxID=2593676 RepID=UPI0018F34397|nr:DUF6274 family protein [Streptomyces sp. DSM 110735]MBJ7902205.1 hypothetical protein [Streptomyces sp. DSM 110735]
MAASARHATRALLRAHLSAASGYRHATRHCPVCHRLQRLAMDTDAHPDAHSDAPTEEPDENPNTRSHKG